MPHTLNRSAQMAMDWTYPANRTDAGLFEIGKRIADALDRAPDATRFSYDVREMLRITRMIENGSRGGRLLSGFQTTLKLSLETKRYADLLASGTEVSVWAVGAKPAIDELAGLDYHEVGPDLVALGNQWFLVSDRPEPIAFVSWELGDASLFGLGGASQEGKRFVGFVSEDPALVSLVMDGLLSGRNELPPPAPAARREPSSAAQTLVADLGAAPDREVDAPAGSVIVPIGRGGDRAAFLVGASLARRGRRLVLVDRSAEGLSSPYGDMRGDDLGRPHPDRLFDAGMARREGRGGTAAFLEAAEAAGIDAGGWFPTKAGGDGIVEAVSRFGGAIVVLPADATRPSLAERIRGMTVDRIRELSRVPVLLAD